MLSRIYKVILIGDINECEAFSKACGSLPTGFLGALITAPMDYLTAMDGVTQFQLCMLGDQDHHVHEDGIKLYAKNADAFIYIMATSSQIEFYEQVRNKKACVAMNYASDYCAPMQCLMNVGRYEELAILEIKNQQCIIEKSRLVLAANTINPQSIFSLLPMELMDAILGKYYTLSHRNLFFTSPSRIETKDEIAVVPKKNTMKKITHSLKRYFHQ